MSIEIDTSSLSSAITSECIQSIPCKIDYNGTAKVKEFFSTSIRTAEDGDLRASFRGRPLHGVKLDVPEDYTGIIMKETRKPFAEDEDRTFKISHTFDHMTYWNLDLKPSSEDKMRHAFDWIHIANAIHAPINDFEDKENNK